jgi:hypothetical protein
MNHRVEQSVHRRSALLRNYVLRKSTLVWVLLLAIAFTGLWYRLRYEDTYISRIPYSAFELAIKEGAGIGLFAVSADGQKFYLRDASGNLLVFDRQGKRVVEIPMPVPLDCAEVAPDGSIVTVGSCQDLRLRFRPNNSDAMIEEIGDEQRIWVIRSDGTIDKARTEGFNRALGEFLDKHARSGDCFVQVAFFTGTQLGLQISAPVSLKDGKPVLKQEMGLLVLRDDGRFERLYYAWAASGDGRLILEDTRLIGLEAQNEWMSKGFSRTEYVILDRSGKESVRSDAPAYPKESVRMRLIQPTQKASKDLSLQFQDLHKEGIILVEGGARLDAQGRLYLPGMTTRRQIHSVPILGRGRLPIQDGYVIARFTSEGQFDRIVARLKMPIDGCRPHQMWDIDAAGTLYYLEFGPKGVGIRSVKD